VQFFPGILKDAALTQIVEKATVSSTAYQYTDKLDKGNYYWQVKAVKPMLSEASPIGSFTVADPSTNMIKTLFPDVSDSASTFIWIGIFIYSAFAILILALVIRTRYF
jgi:hypothetical protein